MSLYFFLSLIALLPLGVFAFYVAFSIWFDARYPPAAEELAREDMECLLQRVNDEFANRPRLSVPASI